MDAVREYVLGIGAAAIICAIVLTFAQQGSMCSLIKLICGLIMTFTIVEPVLHISAGNWESLGIDYHDQAEQAAEEGKKVSEESLRELIKEETEAYILDKARDLHLELSAEVTLSHQAMPVPQSVTIRGTVPPYEKSLLSGILSRELGIEKENQRWIS